MNQRSVRQEACLQCKKELLGIQGLRTASGGPRTHDLGVCPVTTHKELDGAHGGLNGGRACWTIAGSLCGGKIQGIYAQKLNNCWRCDFFVTVKKRKSLRPPDF